MAFSVLHNVLTELCFLILLRLMSRFKHFTLDGTLLVLFITALLPESLKGTKSRKAAHNDDLIKKSKRQDDVICRS